MIDEWAAKGMAMHLSNKDYISAFLKTFPKDCNNSKLLITKCIIEGDRSRFPILVGNVIPHLTLSMEAKELGMSAAKHTIANMSSCLDSVLTSGIELENLPMTTRKGHLVAGKVVGTIEGLHSSAEIWQATTPEQKV